MTEYSQAFGEEKRNYARFKSTKSAELVEVGSGLPVCVKLLDFSSAGARLKLPDVRQISSEFELVIHPEDEMSKKIVKCHLQWQRGRDLGVKFC